MPGDNVASCLEAPGAKLPTIPLIVLAIGFKGRTAKYVTGHIWLLFFDLDLIEVKEAEKYFNNLNSKGQEVFAGYKAGEGKVGNHGHADSMGKANVFHHFTVGLSFLNGG